MNSFAPDYGPAVLALLFVFAYLSLVALLLRWPGPPRVLVPSYQPPAGVSPAVAAWLLSPGDLPRSMAAAAVNMAAKRYLKIQQDGDLYSLIKLGVEPATPLEPEERALDRALFDGYDTFDFDEVTPQLIGASRLFQRCIRNTTYFTDHIALSMPAWIVSAAGTMFAISYANSSHNFLGRYLVYVMIGTFACFIVTVRTIRGPFDKFVSRLPGSTVPRRPWTDADQKPFTFFVATLVGVALLALATTNEAALVTAAFMAVNAVFFHALRGLTRAGKKIAAQLEDYKKFISEVEADPISRSNSAERVPEKLSEKHAYALAFHLDLGWGEQFVTAISDLVECADLTGEFRPGNNHAR